MFDLARIAGSRLVAEVDSHHTLASTNDRALELATRGDPKLPLLVLAERQTLGRGRGANRWWSAPGALTFSLAIDGRLGTTPPQSLPPWSLAAGLAVCEALADLVPRGDWRVKWPNDIFLSGRKVGGI